MDFNNIYEEEKYFPYINIDLDKSRFIRYLVCNMPIFENGHIVYMCTDNIGNYIHLNGFFQKDKENSSFESFIYEGKNSYKVYTVIDKINKNKDYYSIDKFRFNKDNIHITSFIENKGTINKIINYKEEKFSRK